MTDPLILRKEHMEIVVPPGRMIQVNTTKKFTHFFFVGILPEKAGENGKPFPKEGCLGVVDWSIEKEKYIEDSIRIVRFKPRDWDMGKIDDIVSAMCFLKVKLKEWQGEKK